MYPRFRRRQSPRARAANSWLALVCRSPRTRGAEQAPDLVLPVRSLMTYRSSGQVFDLGRGSGSLDGFHSSLGALLR